MFAILLNIVFVFFTGADVDNLVNDYLTDKLSGYEKIEYQIVNAPDNYSVIEIDDSREFKLAGNTGYIPVIIKRNSSRGSSSYISVKLSMYQYVLVAIKDVKKGKPLTAESFDIRLEDISKVKGDVITNPGLLDTFRSKFTIRENSILVKQIVECVPVMFVGDKVKANVISGSVVVTTDAYARQEGGMGDIIVVRTSENKQFRAKIVDNNNVLILE
ncbi:MAG: hypothetical protein SCALA702_27020 [Melioribacteraceae bacterium]|nr:MAG: hypothetical protein SCALA702_27020 [Melioribacteraceae bacterium]